jgi:hypothetical protein
MQPFELCVSTIQPIAWGGLWIFLTLVLSISIWHVSNLFLSWHGWTHRLLGGLLLMWLFFGACTCHILSDIAHNKAAFGYDVILGILGVGATLTAAKEFPHKHVRNSKGQSGTLHQKAIVTQSEMIEHAFYQGLNGIQAVYLHLVHYALPENANRVESKLLMLFMATSPWFFRQMLPVHSFSDNWRMYQREHQHRDAIGVSLSSVRGDVEIVLYKIKKWQYVFYKHVVLHGINLFVAVSDKLPVSTSPPYSLSWRVFWLLLNTSYVMEFFLQSLVKRRTIIRQSTMLGLQRWLMTCASVGAVVVLIQLGSSPATDQPYLHSMLSLASVTLNFTNRHHDVLNTMIIACAVIAARQTWAQWNDS